MTQQDGWIPYDGSGQPVARGVWILPKFRNGDISIGPCEAEDWYWQHHNRKSDIIAYKLVEQST